MWNITVPVGLVVKEKERLKRSSRGLDRCVLVARQTTKVIKLAKYHQANHFHGIPCRASYTSESSKRILTFFKTIHFAKKKLHY